MSGGKYFVSKLAYRPYPAATISKRVYTHAGTRTDTVPIHRTLTSDLTTFHSTGSSAFTSALMHIEAEPYNLFYLLWWLLRVPSFLLPPFLFFSYISPTYNLDAQNYSDQAYLSLGDFYSVQEIWQILESMPKPSDSFSKEIRRIALSEVK